MDDNRMIIDAILKNTCKEGERQKLPCAAALRIAKKFGIKTLKVGTICNERGIKIVRCQLGCFE